MSLFNFNREFEKSFQTFAKKVIVSGYIDTCEITKLIYSINSIRFFENELGYMELLLKDSRDLILDNFIVCNGDNAITINFSSSVVNENFTFIGKIIQFTPIDKENQIYSVKAVSHWRFCNFNAGPLQLGFPGILEVSSILSMLLYDSSLLPENYGSFSVIEPTPNCKIENFIIPGWNLTQTISYLVNFCKEENSGFMFFEDTNHFLNIISQQQFITSHIEEIYSMAFSNGQSVPEKENVIKYSNNGVYYDVIYNYDFAGYDLKSLQEKKAFGLNSILFDYADKNIHTNIHRFGKYFNDLNALYDKHILNMDLETNIVNPKYNLYNEFPDRELFDAYGRNKIAFGLMDSFRIRIRTNFRNFKLGQKVYLRPPSATGSIEHLTGIWHIIGLEHKYESVSAIDNANFVYTDLYLARESFNIDKKISAKNMCITKTTK